VSGEVAVRTVDLGEPVGDLTGLSGYDRVRVYALFEGEVLGFTELATYGGSVGERRLRAALVQALGVKPLAASSGLSEQLVWAGLYASLARDLLPPGAEPTDTVVADLDPSVTASVVVATLDRPADLRNCLGYIRCQDSARAIEIVVVDNHPDSGLTPPVLEDFPDVVLVNESRRGLAYARNAGILAASGELIVMTDDDVVAPPDWLEKLLAPFARLDVATVTGNVLPLELETHAQRLFEVYGGLGRGFERQEVNAGWFERCKWAVPTWRLGASANAAFRAKIFAEPEVGLMREALGPGMPSGVGEDTYLFYKVLKAGYTMVYEPGAYVWHRHRRDMDSLRKQLYDYSKGHVAYHLTTLLEDRDLRALGYLALRLPVGHARRIARRLRRRTPYPMSLSVLELKGNLAGASALWQSHNRVRREGRSRAPSPH
jgi:O-antigen biosynthesis protein